MEHNEKTNIDETTMDDFLRDEQISSKPRKRRGGRPKGSLNKRILVKEVIRVYGWADKQHANSIEE